MNVLQRIGDELACKASQVEAAAVTLLDEWTTVPFSSRYRKEATGGLDVRYLMMTSLPMRIGALLV